jgi:branched-chain amino acid transport system permease protein
MINFAHGEIFMIGAYVGWWVLSWLLQAQVGGLHPAWVVPLMLVHAMLFTGLLGVLLERFAYRPLYMRGATRLGPLISAIGASIFLQNAVMLTQGARMKVYMTSLLFPRTWRFQVAGSASRSSSWSWSGWPPP